MSEQLSQQTYFDQAIGFTFSYYDIPEVDRLVMKLENQIEQLKAETRTDNSAAIEKLKAENERLKDELDVANNQCENLINSATDIMLRQDKANDTKCAEIEKLTTDNRRLKHALWLARAERAADRARIFYFNDLTTMLDIDGFSYDSKKKKGHKKLTARSWRIIWEKVERKCRAKMEKYK